MKKEHVLLKATVEKLDGGYITDITGKRKIFTDKGDMCDAFGIAQVFDVMNDEEYEISVTLIPTSDIRNGLVTSNVAIAIPKQECEEEPESASELIEKAESSGLSIWEQAKKDGIIQAVEPYNPLPATVEHVDDTDPHNIVVTAKNAYTAAELKAINWKEYDDHCPLTMHQRASISGYSYGGIHTLWATMIKGTLKCETINSRIKLTILAKFYELKMGIASVIYTAEDMEAFKSDINLIVKEMELMLTHATNGFVKATSINSPLQRLKSLVTVKTEGE